MAFVTFWIPQAVVMVVVKLLIIEVIKLFEYHFKKGICFGTRGSQVQILSLRTFRVLKNSFIPSIYKPISRVFTVSHSLIIQRNFTLFYQDINPHSLQIRYLYRWDLKQNVTEHIGRFTDLILLSVSLIFQKNLSLILNLKQ